MGVGPAVHAQEPLYVKNLSPVAGLLGLPSQRDAGIGPVGRVSVAAHTSIASHYISERSGDESLAFDGETLRVALELRYALATDWDLQLELPWLDHSGGSLDSLIDNWHELWGMSDGGRSDVPRDALDYSYQGADSFTLRDDSSGLGDATLALSYRFYQQEATSVALALGYKFATGDEQDFTGSGAADAFLTLRFSGDHLADLPLRWHGQLGYLRAGRSDLVSEVQQRDIWYAGLSLDWQLGSAWSLIGQVDAHAAPADSAITALGDEAIMLTVGGRWKITPRWSMELSVIEDVQVETAPDVTFQASVRYRP